MADDHELEDDPAAAFEALRAEVAALRASVERRGDRAAPDYAPTLGQIADTLAKIEGHPALQSTPDGFASLIRQAGEAAQQQAGRTLNSAAQQVRGAADELQHLLGGQRTVRQQDKWLAIMTGVGAVAGMVLWVVVSGPVARALPTGWAVPETMAAATLHLDRWQAGEQVMASQDPAQWKADVEAIALVKANLEPLAACQRQAVRMGKAQRCVVTLPPVLSR